MVCQLDWALDGVGRLGWELGDKAEIKDPGAAAQKGGRLTNGPTD